MIKNCFLRQNVVSLSPKMQFEVSDCGTTEMIMINETDYGSRNIGLTVPCQFMHTANTIVQKSDYGNFRKLLSLLLFGGKFS